MYPTQNRLPRNQFRAVFETGTRLHTYEMTIISSRTDLKEDRFSVIVGKSVHKHAVVRNRIKRLIRESLHRLLSHLRSGYDIVVITKRDISGKKQEEVENEMKKLFFRLHLLRQEKE